MRSEILIMTSIEMAVSVILRGYLENEHVKYVIR